MREREMKLCGKQDSFGRVGLDSQVRVCMCVCLGIFGNFWISTTSLSVVDTRRPQENIFDFFTTGSTTFWILEVASKLFNTNSSVSDACQRLVESF